MKWVTILVASIAAGGCAQLEFYPDPGPRGSHGLPFWVGAPYLQSSVAADCTQTHTVVMIPQERWTVVPRGGLLGSSNLTVKFADGMITEFGQNTDPQLDETIGALAKAGIVGSPAESFAPGGSGGCQPWSALTPIVKDTAVAVPEIPWSELRNREAD